jgi:hypothetical protein
MATFSVSNCSCRSCNSAPIENFDLFGPPHTDGIPPHSRERLTVWLRDLDAFAEVTLVRIYSDGVTIRQCCGGGAR